MQRLIHQHPLQRGAHPTRDDGMCAMEMVSWLGGEAHSDEPRCSCPVIAAFVRACNDAMGDEARNRHLRPLVPQLVNTRRTAEVERARGMLVLDDLVRTLLPVWLRRQGRRDEETLLASLPPVRTLDDVRAVLRAIETFVPDHSASRWVLQRAIDGLPPARYVAGAVQVERAMNDTATWSLAADLVLRMARAGSEAEPRLAEGTA
jgi:hypothetical protein